MKKTLSVLMAMAMAASLAGCGGNKAETTTAAPAAETTAAASEAAATEAAKETTAAPAADEKLVP